MLYRADEHTVKGTGRYDYKGNDDPFPNGVLTVNNNGFKEVDGNQR